MRWDDVPLYVRRAVETALGAPVVNARTRAGGFSPGVAARVRLANGRTAFVKALSASHHRASVDLYRMEAATMPHLPPGLPVPQLLHAYDDGDWVTLVYEEIVGRQPAVPWRQDELARVSALLSQLGAALQPSPWRDAPGYAEANGAFMHAWKELAATPDGLETSVRGPLDCLATGEIDLAELVRGDTLLHNDIRSDNLLLTPDGNLVLVDWGQTCQGTSWLDLVMFALTVNFEGGADADLLVREHPLTRAVPHHIVDGVLVASFAAYRWLSHRSGSEYHRNAARNQAEKPGPKVTSTAGRDGQCWTTHGIGLTGRR